MAIKHIKDANTARRQVHLDATLAGPLLMLSAALLFTMLNILVKLMGPAYTVWHIGFFRFFGGVLVLVVLFGRHGNPYRGRDVRLLIIRGCTGSVAFISVIMAIRLLPVSTAMVIFYAYPAFSAVFSFLLYGEKIGKIEIGCIGVIMIGIAVLFEFQVVGNLFGQVMAIIGAVFAGVTVTLIRTLRVKNGPVVIYLYFCTMGTLATLPEFILHPIVPADALEWAMVLGIVLVSVLAQLLMNQGFFYCRGWEGGVFMSSEVIFTAIVGIVFLGDPADWRFWVGGCLILGSVIALNRIKAGKAKTALLPKAS